MSLIIALAVFLVLLAVLWHFSRRALSGADSIEAIRADAERGDVYSQFRLAQVLFEGKGTDRDDAQAAKWFLKAAEQDHAEAQYILATMYEKGIGVRRSDDEAFSWYLQAATQGHERASVILEADKWTIYKQRHLVKDEMPVHGDLEKQASEKPLEGDALKDKLQKYLAKASDGNVDAQYNLGIMYYHGEGVSQDHEEALRWFHLAAEQDDADAQYNLGFMYGRGEGTPKNHRESLNWFQKAAAQGHTGAKEILEKMFKKS